MGDDELDGGGVRPGAGADGRQSTRAGDGGGAAATATATAPPVDPPGRRPLTGGGGSRRRATGDSRAPYGWWPVAVIISVALVDRLESSVLSAILVDLQDEWGFSDTAGGMLSAAISIMGTALALPAGYLADRANRKNLLAVIVAVWSFITLGSAVSISFTMFFVTRLALAAADSIDNPSQVSLLADYYSVEVRPKVLGFHRMITFAGGALGTMYGGIVAQLWGWRAVFYIIIIPGLVVAWWCHRLREPRRGEADARAAQAGLAAAARASGDADGNGQGAVDRADVTQIAAAGGATRGEVAGTGAGDDNGRPSATSGFDTVDLTQERGIRALFSQIGTVLRIRTIVLVYTGLAVLFFGLSGIFFWLPTFYQRDFGLESGPAGTLTAGITLVGVVGGTWIGGVIGERVHGKVKGGRVLAGGTGIALGSIVFPVSLQSSTLTAQALFLGVAVTFMSVAIPNLQSAIADALPANQRGVGFSLLGIFTTFGAFGPLLVGAISDATGSLVTAFGYLLVPMVIGGVVTIAGRTTFDRDVQRAFDTVVTAAGAGRDAGGPDDDGPTPGPGNGGPPDRGPGPWPDGPDGGAGEAATGGRSRETTSGEGAGAAEARAVLAEIRGLGPAKVAALVAHFGTLEAIRSADVEELLTVPGVGRGTAEAIRRALDS